MAWDIGVDHPSGTNTTLAVASAAIGLSTSVLSLVYGASQLNVASASIGMSSDGPVLIRGPWSVDFSGRAQRLLFKFEVWDGATWVDLTAGSG